MPRNGVQDGARPSHPPTFLRSPPRFTSPPASLSARSSSSLLRALSRRRRRRPCIDRGMKSAALPLWPVESGGLSAFSIRHHPTAAAATVRFFALSHPRTAIPLFVFTALSVMHTRRYAHAKLERHTCTRAFYHFTIPLACEIVNDSFCATCFFFAKKSRLRIFVILQCSFQSYRKKVFFKQEYAISNAIHISDIIHSINTKYESQILNLI